MSSDDRATITCGSSSAAGGRSHHQEQQQRLIHRDSSMGRSMMEQFDDTVPSLRSLLLRAVTRPASAPSHPPSSSSLSLPSGESLEPAAEPLNIAQILERAVEQMTSTTSAASILSSEEEEQNSEEGQSRYGDSRYPFF